MVDDSHVVRPLVETDLDAVAQIEQNSRPSPWSHKQFAAELSAANSYPFVLLINNKMAGYVILWLIADEIQIQNIVVAASHRGKRLGKLLLNIALNQGLEGGATSAILEVRESNEPAIGLYRKYQFEVVGRREKYYRNGENALLMTAGPFETPDTLAAYKAFIINQQQALKKSLQFVFAHK
ncbi:MAG: ribosomal protein S18-alanine N-acetyltransferase [Chloroflexota bacterium]